MLILDTMNILHTVGVLPPDIAGLDVPSLAILIARSRYVGERTLFICDGLPATDLAPAGPLLIDGSPDGTFEVRYSGSGTIADDLIKKMVDASTAPRRLTVVSTDHEILRHARKRRCNALTSEEFLGHLADDARLTRPASPLPRRPSSMSDEQVRKWIDVFDVDVQRLHDEVAQKAIAVEPRTSVDPDVAIDASVTENDQSSDENPQTDDTTAATMHSKASELPSELIAEAEAMLQREAETAARRKASQAAAPSPERPAPDTPDQRLEPSADSKDQSVGDVAIDQLDMNAILPDDGRTLPIRKREQRHRQDR